MDELNRTSFNEQLTYRLIPSKYPPISLYEDVADADEFEALYAVESLTNPRLAEELGDISLVEPEDRLLGIPHCSYVMAAFTHINPNGGRFNTADFGAYYAAKELETAFNETTYHMERMMAYTNEPPQQIQMRSIEAVFTGDLVDVRGEPDSPIYDENSHAHGKELAIKLKMQRDNGIVYSSVRKKGHDCYALLKPRLVNKVCQSAHYAYCWDGSKINAILEQSLVR